MIRLSSHRFVAAFHPLPLRALPLLLGFALTAEGVLSTRSPARAAEPAPLAPREAHPLEALLPQFSPLSRWDEDLLFPPGISSLEKLPAPQRQELLAKVRSALLAAFPTDREPTPATMARAQASIAAARALAPSESRISYAAGLVALAARDWTEAEARFADALRQAPPVHAGALMGTIYAQLGSHDPIAAAQSCRRLAQGLADEQNAWPGPRQAVAFSLWLGRAAACCDHLARNPVDNPAPTPAQRPVAQPARTHASLTPLRDELRSELSDRLGDSFLEGYDSVAARLVGLQPWLDMSTTQLRSETASLRQRFEDPIERIRLREQRLEQELARQKPAHAAALKLSAQPLSELTRQLASRLSGARTLNSQLDSHKRKYTQLASQLTFLENNLSYRIQLNEWRDEAQDRDHDRDIPRRSRDRSYVPRRLPPALQAEDRSLSGMRAKLQQYGAQIHTLELGLQTRLDDLQQFRKLVDERRGDHNQLKAQQQSAVKALQRQLAQLKQQRIELQRQSARLLDALQHPEQLRRLVDSPEPWLPLNPAGQRDTLLQSLRQ